MTSSRIYLSLMVISCIRSVICHTRYEAMRCSSEPSCCCTKRTDGTLNADCSGKGLKQAPVFTDDVTSIDLSNNFINIFPHSGEIPSTVTQLDLSKNRLIRFDGNPFQIMKKLEHLDLSENQLIYKESIYKLTVFENLVQLKTINLKYNNFNVKVDSYPTALAALKNLQTLKIDGKKDASFGVRFKMLRNLKVLDLSGKKDNVTCTISKLEKNLLRHFPSLTNLSLSSCNLDSVEIGSLNYLQNITYLNLSHNRHLTFRTFRNISHDLKFTDIKVLDVSAIHCAFGVGTILFRDDLIELQNSTLREIYLDGNRLEMFDDDVIPALPRSLEIVSLAYNKMTAGMYAYQYNFMKSLRRIFASHQIFASNLFIANKMTLCNDWRCPRSFQTETLPRQTHTWNFEYLTEINTYGNNHRDTIMNGYDNKTIKNQLICYPLPPNLIEFDLSYSSLRMDLRYINFCEENVVEIIKLQRNYIQIFDGPILNLRNLRYVDLSMNLGNNISTVFFDGSPNLQVLNMSYNMFGNSMQYDQKGQIFRNLANLKTMDLSFNRISELPPLIFANLKNMTFLIVKNNDLRNWSVHIGHMHHLLYLDLSNNQLPKLGVTARRDIALILKNSTLRVDLTNNPLLCNCESQDFLIWLYEHKDIFHLFEQYQCSLNNNSKLIFRDLEMTLLPYLEKTCRNFNLLIIGTVLAIFFCIFVVISTIIYRFRWRLRYLYYMTKSRYLGYSTINRKIDGHEYEYDAFISYANEDNRFIEILQSKFETENNFHVCIHERDFLGGVPIADNIATAVNKSHKIIIILSSFYLKSYWCMFELNMARMESIYSREGANILILVFYDQVKSRDIPLHLMDLINTKTYLEYPNDPDGGDIVFWNQMLQAVAR